MKIRAIGLLAAATLTLAGCGGNEAAAPDADPALEAEAEMTTPEPTMEAADAGMEEPADGAEGAGAASEDDLDGTGNPIGPGRATSTAAPAAPPAE